MLRTSLVTLLLLLGLSFGPLSQLSPHTIKLLSPVFSPAPEARVMDPCIVYAQ